MKTIERGVRHESLESSIARIAGTYGFTNAPIQVSKRAAVAANTKNDQTDTGHHTALQLALLGTTHNVRTATQLWGSTKKNGSTTIGFSILGTTRTISHALVVKTALSIAELAGYKDTTLSVSTIGDAESQRRFYRELNTFFKKNSEVISPELKAQLARDPEGAYRTILMTEPTLVERLPRPIDHLSESSRKIMTETLALFEAVGINYTLEAHLPSTAGTHGELLFAIHGTSAKGVRTLVASGGRLDEYYKKNEKSAVGHAVGISLTVPGTIETEPPDVQVQCFVVHVGEAARLRAFSLLEALWRAHVALSQALLAEGLREQIDKSKSSKAQYVAIIGQRETLDGTVIVRNASTQSQTSVPVEKLVAAVTRGKR